MLNPGYFDTMTAILDVRSSWRGKPSAHIGFTGISDTATGKMTNQVGTCGLQGRVKIYLQNVGLPGTGGERRREYAQPGAAHPRGGAPFSNAVSHKPVPTATVLAILSNLARGGLANIAPPRCYIISPTLTDVRNRCWQDAPLWCNVMQ